MSTGKDFATALYSILTHRRNYKVFVAHILREQLEGNFREENINPVIDNCKIFILINSLDALDRSEIIREVQRAFPNGNRQNHILWVFRENKDDVPYVTQNFREQTQIDLRSIHQDPFHNESELVRAAIRKCDNRRQFVAATSQTQISPIIPIRFSIKIKTTTQINVNQLIEELDNKIKNKQYREALDVCDRLLILDSTNISLLNNKGILLDVLGEHAEAIVNFELAISLDKKNPSLWNNKAIALWRYGKFNEALQIADKALSLEPHGIELMKTKGVILAALERYQDSFNLYEEALKIKPKDSGLISSKAAMLNQLGNSDEAMKLLEESLKLDEKNDNAWYNFGVMLAEKEEDFKKIRSNAEFQAILK